SYPSCHLNSVQMSRVLSFKSLCNKATVDYQPVMAQPDLSQLSPFLREYILAVAGGIQSSDPTNGLFEMLKPLQINRSNVDAYREGTMKVNLDDILKLQQQIQDGLKGR
ncbi:hypothetical protein RJC67_00005, partial [Acinetobacter baumannii]|nr:hypothetical protein [Acinetobacter baumannii]